MAKHKKIWESIYPNQEYAIDFTGQIILRDEFKTGKSYSWNYDYYDYEEDEKFIANENVIEKRNKQSVFEYKNEKYISMRNENFSYSILSPTKIIDKNNPISYDLFLANKLTNYKSSDFLVLSITYKKMLPSINDIFISFVNESIKVNLDFEYMKLDNNNPYKNKLFYLIDKNKFNVVQILNTSLIIKSLILNFSIRAFEKYNSIWQNEETILNDDSFFNIFLFTSNDKENIFISNEKTFTNFVETFDNRVLINSILKKEYESTGMLSNEFTKLYEYDDNVIYSYDYSNNKFHSFYLDIKNRRK